MKYIEMTVEEAAKKLNKNQTVLVAVQDLADEDVDIVFVRKNKSEYSSLLEDVKTVASIYDDFAKQMKMFTEKQDIYNIKRKGRLKTVLFLRE